jgi:polar amino acid transport system substrate-binding protein
MRIWPTTFGSETGVLIRRTLLLLLFVMAGAYAPVFAQNTSAPVRVSTFVLAPFVIEEDGNLSGFSIDLWNEIAARLHLQSTFQRASDVNAVFQSLRMDQADVAVSGLFYSAERDREFGVAVLLIVFAAHVVWLIERVQTSDPTSRVGYFPGVFRAMYWAATTLMSQGDQAPRHWLARVIAVLWMFVGIIFIASYTAQLTTTLTVQHIRGSIDGPNDLPGKQVATLSGGSAVAYLNAHGAVVRQYAQNRDMFQALLNGDVDAVVQGSAGLDYYATHEGMGQVRMVGPEFNPNDVGFVFPVHSPLRRQVDSALLSMREDGTYERIYDKWFGTP